jgi:microcystin-dependent protein
MILGSGSAASGTLTPRANGSTGGVETVTITAATMPSHTHPITDVTHNHNVTNPTHTHTVTDPNHNHGVTDTTHFHNVVTTGAGGIGFNIGVNYVGSSEGYQSPATGTKGTYTSAAIANYTAANVSVNTGPTGINTANANAQTTSLGTALTGLAATQSTGSDGAHNIVDPYVAMGYIIKAT